MAKSSDWHERLRASTRGQVLLLLRSRERTVNDLAAELDLTDNAVRAHLLSLERDGFVQRTGREAGVRKPHVTYGLTEEAEQVFPKAYGPLLNYFVSLVARRLKPRALRAILRELGRMVAGERSQKIKGKSKAERIKAALALLKELGGSATFSENDGRHFIQGNGCPLAAITATHPEACLIAESLLTEMIGAPVKERCSHGPNPSCRFEIH